MNLQSQTKSIIREKDQVSGLALNVNKQAS